MKITLFTSAMIMFSLFSCQRESEKSEWEIQEAKIDAKIVEISRKCKNCIPIDSLRVDWTYQFQKQIAITPNLIIGKFEIKDVIIDSVNHYRLEMEAGFMPTLVISLRCTEELFNEMYPRFYQDGYAQTYIDNMVLIAKVEKVRKPDFSFPAEQIASERTDWEFHLDLESPDMFIVTGDLISFESL